MDGRFVANGKLWSTFHDTLLTTLQNAFLLQLFYTFDDTHVALKTPCVSKV